MEILQSKIKVILYDPNWKARDISKSVTSLSLSGDLDSLSRKAEITLLDAKFNGNNVKCGDIDFGYFVHVFLDNKVALKGIIVDFSNSQENIKIKVYDYMFYLNKSKITHNFSNTTAESATKKILNELDVASGSLAQTGIAINRLIKSKTASNAILDLYYQASCQNNKRYFLDMDDNKVCVRELGKLLTNKKIEVGKNIIDSSLELKKSIDGTVNIVKCYDDKGNFVGEVANKALAKLGVLQDNYTVEKDKDWHVVAKNKLKDIKYQFSVTVVGNFAYRSGYSAYVYIPQLQINYPMYILSDEHDFDLQTNTFTTKLELTWANQLEQKGDDDN